MIHTRFLLLGITILLIHFAANAQTTPSIPGVPRQKPDGPVVAPPLDAQPRRELRLLVPDGFGGLKEEPPITGSTPDGVDIPRPPVDPNEVKPTR